MNKYLKKMDKFKSLIWLIVFEILRYLRLNLQVFYL